MENRPVNNETEIPNKPDGTTKTGTSAAEQYRKNKHHHNASAGKRRRCRSHSEGAGLNDF